MIDGKEIAAQVRAEVVSGVQALVNEQGVTPGLGVILVGDDPASHSYVGGKERACEEAGIYTETLRLPASTTQAEVLQKVAQFNEDPAFHGILVQLPLPGHIDEDTIIRAVLPIKDVDGLHPENAGLLFAGTPRFAPATPLGVQRMLIEESVDTNGANAVIVGRSKLVGRPLAALLLGRGKGANATVTVCHTGTKDLGAHTRRAEILIAAAGRPGTITAEMVKPGAVVIDVGVNRIDDPGRKRGYRLVGDVDFDSVSEVASAITPVPGGVGPMTITMLLQNVLHAARLATAG